MDQQPYFQTEHPGAEAAPEPSGSWFDKIPVWTVVVTLCVTVIPLVATLPRATSAYHAGELVGGALMTGLVTHLFARLVHHLWTGNWYSSKVPITRKNAFAGYAGGKVIAIILGFFLLSVVAGAVGSILAVGSKQSKPERAKSE
jgi:hypothetical protein